MKKVLTCAMFIPVASFGAAHGALGVGQVALFATSVTVAASSNFVHAFQSMPCAGEPDQCKEDDAFNALLKQRKDRQLVWQRNQESFLKRCTKGEIAVPGDDTTALKCNIVGCWIDPVHETFAFCPQEGESLDSFVKRAIDAKLQILQGEREALPTEALFKDDFWDLPWSMKRFLLAVNIDVGLLDVNDVLPVSKLTPLDHAAQQKDQEMIFYLWERGARGAKDQDTLGYVKKDVMMRSSDERSIEILREIVSREDGKSRDWLTFEWATDLDPELVKRKVGVLVKPVYNALGQMRPKLRYSKQEADNIPGDTPGAQLLRRFAQSNTDAGEGCTIL